MWVPGDLAWPVFCFLSSDLWGPRGNNLMRKAQAKGNLCPSYDFKGVALGSATVLWPCPPSHFLGWQEGSGHHPFPPYQPTD